MEFGPEMFLSGAAWYVAFIFSLTVHEAAHAWSALRLGDPTAYHGGQVTLDPIPHMRREPFGTILMPILSFAWMGWMMGWASAPYDPTWARRFPKRAGLMALAGPVSNLLLTVVAGVALRVGLKVGWFELPTADVFGFDHLVTAAEPGMAEGVAMVLSVLFSLNFLLFLFNLLPLPPLDGAAVLQLVLDERLVQRYQEFMAQPMFALVGLIAAWRLLGLVFWPIYSGVVLPILYSGLL